MSEDRELKYSFRNEWLYPHQLEMELEASRETTSGERLAELAAKNIKLALIVAKNVVTPSALLEQLSREDEPLIRAAVTQNPNTPVKVLLELGKQFPQALLDNPVLPLLWLEEPNFIAKIPLETLVILFKIPQGQEMLLELAANSDSFSIRYSAAQTLEDSHCELRWLEHFTKSPYEDIRVAIVNNPKTPLSLLESFANDSSCFLRTRLARHPNISVLLLEKLARDRVGDVRAAVAKSSQVPISVLEELAADCTVSVRCSVAANPQTPLWILERCSRDENRKVVAAVANNPSISLQLLSNCLAILNLSVGQNQPGNF